MRIFNLGCQYLQKTLGKTKYKPPCVTVQPSCHAPTCFLRPPPCSLTASPSHPAQSSESSTCTGDLPLTTGCSELRCPAGQPWATWGLWAFEMWLVQLRNCILNFIQFHLSSIFIPTCGPWLPQWRVQQRVWGSHGPLGLRTRCNLCCLSLFD